jgi:hypothetical protein
MEMLGRSRRGLLRGEAGPSLLRTDDHGQYSIAWSVVGMTFERSVYSLCALLRTIFVASAAICAGSLCQMRAKTNAACTGAVLSLAGTRADYAGPIMIDAGADVRPTFFEVWEGHSKPPLTYRKRPREVLHSSRRLHPVDQ